MEHPKNPFNERLTEKTLETVKPVIDRHNLSPNDFETLVEVFRTLLKWQNENDRITNRADISTTGR